MVLVIYIPVLFVCMNGSCNFMQATKYYTRESECKAALVEQRIRLEEMAARGGQTLTLLQGTCITARGRGTHQPIADKRWYGKKWARMCAEKTHKAASATKDAFAAACISSANDDPANAAWLATAAAGAANDAWATKYMQQAIKAIKQANKETL
jgi:hypothetical protein